MVGREAESLLLRAITLRANVLVVGDPGSGKTTLLNVVERRLEDQGRTVVFVDAQPGTSLWSLLWLVARQLGADTTELWDIEPNEAGGVSTQPRPISQREILFFLDLLPDGAVVLVDGLAPETAFELFGRFRDVLFEADLQWVATANRSDRSTFLRPPADGFFGAVVELEPLTPGQIEEMLVRRASTASDAEARRLREIAQELSGLGRPLTPRVVLVAALRAMMSDEPGAVSVNRRAMRREEARALGYPALRVFDALAELRGAHAGDERLLERTGTSRPRAAQLLKELEEAGLVVAHSEGRRKVYQVVS